MRTFYIFKIKSEFTILTKEVPYNLFRIIDNLYYLDTESLGIYKNMYGKLFETFNVSYVNRKLNNIFCNNKYYRYNEKFHEIINDNNGEKSRLIVYKSHILLKSNMIKPTLLINYLMSDNLFVCDFKNKDYFWLNEIVRL